MCFFGNHFVCQLRTLCLCRIFELYLQISNTISTKGRAKSRLNELVVIFIRRYNYFMLIADSASVPDAYRTITDVDILKSVRFIISFPARKDFMINSRVLSSNGVLQLVKAHLAKRVNNKIVKPRVQTVFCSLPPLRQQFISSRRAGPGSPVQLGPVNSKLSQTGYEKCYCQII